MERKSRERYELAFNDLRNVSLVFQVIRVALNRQDSVTEILSEPLTGIQRLRVEILTIGEGSSGSLRLEILGCSEGA